MPRDRRPLLAILTLAKRPTRLGGGRSTVPFRGRPKLYADLIRIARRRGEQAFVLPWNGKRLKEPLIGYVHYGPGKGKWVKKRFRWPYVVYNRIPLRAAEERESFRELIRTLEANGCSFYNQGFINKAALYEQLQKGAMSDWLPRTEPYSLSSFTEMVNRYGRVFLKPAHSSQGKGVCLVRRRTDGRYHIKGLFLKANGKLLRLANVTSGSAIDSLLSKFGARDYVCQQAIRLPVWQNSKFDIRVLMQKNGQGRWQLTGWGARQNDRRRVTTHVPRGGRLGNIRVLTRNVFGAERGRALLLNLRRELGRLSLEVEKALGSDMGEMSMDVVIDPQGKFWILEANAKPMKFDEPSIYRKSCRTTIDYCLYLKRLAKQKKQVQSAGAYGKDVRGINNNKLTVLKVADHQA